MQLQQATELIRATMAALDRDYGRQVFDELAIVRISAHKPYLAWYDGPRRATFVANYSDNTAALRAELRSQGIASHSVGDFDFAHDGERGEADALLMVGPGLYLVCGHTALSVAEITRNPRWLTAQRHFVTMSERFRRDPLVLAATPAAAVEGEAHPS